MEILIVDEDSINTGDISWRRYQELGNLTICSDMQSPACADALTTVNCLITVGSQITKNVIDRCGQLRYIGALATGYDIIDTAYARQKGIVVTNVPSYGTDSVAQYTFALLLELCHHVGLHDKAVRDCEWARRGHFSFWLRSMTELSGKALGVIGFGRIGQAVAKLGKAFGMRILAFDPLIAPGSKVDDCVCVTFDEVLSSADVITLHCPMTPENQNLMNRDNITKMKQGVLLINAARGGLICEMDLINALQSGHIAAAALDVVTDEPLPDDSPLLCAPNLLITPHIAWATTEARRRIVDMGVDNLKAFLQGTPIHVV